MNLFTPAERALISLASWAMTGRMESCSYRFSGSEDEREVRDQLTLIFRAAGFSTLALNEALNRSYIEPVELESRDVAMVNDLVNRADPVLPSVLASALFAAGVTPSAVSA